MRDEEHGSVRGGNMGSDGGEPFLGSGRGEVDDHRANPLALKFLRWVLERDCLAADRGKGGGDGGTNLWRG